MKKIIIKKVGNDFNNWDILDGRTKQGRPFKKFAKAMDFAMYLLGCASLSFIIVYFFFQWIA